MAQENKKTPALFGLTIDWGPTSLADVPKRVEQLESTLQAIRQCGTIRWVDNGRDVWVVQNQSLDDKSSKAYDRLCVLGETTALAFKVVTISYPTTDAELETMLSELGKHLLTKAFQHPGDGKKTCKTAGTRSLRS